MNMDAGKNFALQIVAKLLQIATWLLLTSWAYSEFFAILGCNTHFKSELRWNGWR